MTAEQILRDGHGRLTVTFQEAVAAIAEILTGAVDSVPRLSETSPNEARRILDGVLDRTAADPARQEDVLKVAWAYGERRLIRSLSRGVASEVRHRAQDWAEKRVTRRKEERCAQRKGGAPFDSRAQSLGGDVPDEAVQIVQAAIRLFDGEVLGKPTDGTHPDVVENLDRGTQARLAKDVESEGFLDAHGNYLDRGQASVVTGVAGESSEVAGTLQGVRLRKVQEDSLRSGGEPTGGLELDESDVDDSLGFIEQFRTDRVL